MKTLGNFIWFILGGLLLGIGWMCTGLLMYITFTGIPWGRSCLVIGKFIFAPFGREAISRKELTGESDLGTGALGWLANIIWFVLCGWWLAVGHVIAGVLNCITIIWIPFGIQHFKLAGVALSPVGKTVVQKEVADEARRRNAAEFVTARRER